MSLDTIKTLLPEHAKDIKLNLSSALESENLSAEQAWGTALACAYIIGQETLLDAVESDPNNPLDETHITAAKTAASLMGMNNIYYRFGHLVEDHEYLKMPPRLRMNGLANHGVDKATFELWSLAVSAITGCGLCITSHEKVVTSHGISKLGVQDAIRIASILHATAVVLRAEGK